MIDSLAMSAAPEANFSSRHDAALNRISRMNSAALQGKKFQTIKPDQQQQLKEAAQEFEAVFLSQMLEHMFAGVETNELFGGGHAEDIYRSMMIDEYGKIIARSGGIGIADHVIRELQQTQEVK